MFLRHKVVWKSRIPTAPYIIYFTYPNFAQQEVEKYLWTALEVAEIFVSDSITGRLNVNMFTCSFSDKNKFVYRVGAQHGTWI